MDVGKNSKWITSVNHPCHDGFLHFAPDVPHILKNLRSLFCSGQDITLPDDIVQAEGLPSPQVCLSHVWELLKFDQDKYLKVAPKLNEKILNPSHFDKMSVASAMALWSAEVSQGIKYLVAKHGYSRSMLTTSWFIETVHHWFELANSRNPSSALSLKHINKYNEAIVFLRKVIDLFKNLKISKNGKISWKPIQTGVIMATTTLLRLQEELVQGRRLIYFLTSRVSQDALENTFSVVRLKCPLPSAKQVRYALKNISISQFSKEQRNSSYEYADSDFLADFLKKRPKSEETPSVDMEMESDDELFQEMSVSVTSEENDSIDNDNLIPTTKPNSSVSTCGEDDIVFYIAGNTIRRVQQQYKTCKDCYSALMDDPSSTCNASSLTSLKDFTGKSLVYCKTIVFENVFKRAEAVFQNFATTNQLKGPNVKARLLAKCGQVVIEEIPDCHCIIQSLFKQYLKTRLFSHGKRETEKILSQLKAQRARHERSSKTLEMRKCVDNMK